MFRNFLLKTKLVARSARGLSTTPSLSPETIRIVKSTAPVMAEHGYTITTEMYKRMLSENSPVKDMFNPTHQVVLPGEVKARQPYALACSIHAYAANIDNLGALSEAVERIAQKHVSLHVLPHQYEFVKENLMWAVVKVLKDAVTPEVAAAWSEAYDFLAYLLIERERKLRNEKAEAVGGWEGYREFKVDSVTPEGGNIVSFVMKPADGKPILDYLPGQYIAIRVPTASGVTVRNYTLSSAPGKDGYRITVKKAAPLLPDCPPGAVSTHLHTQVKVGDAIQVGVPCGDYYLKVPDEKPIVLISGGVGITPSLCMLEYIMENTNIKNHVTMIQTWRSPEGEAMHDEIEHLCKTKQRSNLTIKSLYDDDVTKFPDGNTLMRNIDSLVVDRDSHYYFCGPTEFMQKIYGGLREWQIPENQINYEFFGPVNNI